MARKAGAYRKGQASNNNVGGAFVWSASSVVVAAVELSFALLVLLCAVLSFFTSRFIRIAGVRVPCATCLVSRLKRCFEETEENHNDVRICNHFDSAEEEPNAFSSKTEENHNDRICNHFDSAEEPNAFTSKTEENQLGVRICNHFASAEEPNAFSYSSSRSSCAHVEDKIVPAERSSLEESLEESNENSGAHQERRKSVVNAAAEQGKAADRGNGDGAQWQDESCREPDAQQLQEEEEEEEEEALAAMYLLELEKERNASATAANEAMGMIARLQEEKAAVLLEARQFQRLVEEKSMHDQEAIASLQKVLAKNAEEKSRLEDEIQFYRLKFLREQMEEQEEESSRGARSNGNSFEKTLRIRAFLEEQQQQQQQERSPEKAFASASMIKEKTPASARAEAARSSSSKAALLGLGTSKKTGRATGLLSKKQAVDALVMKPENGNNEAQERRSLKRRPSSPPPPRPPPRPPPSDAVTASLDKAQEAVAAAEKLSDRALEERRLSVLEYVWKLEEEFHEKATRQPALIGRGGRSRSVHQQQQQRRQVLRSKTQTPVERTVSLETDTKEAAETTVMMSVVTEDDHHPFWQSCHDRKTTTERNSDVSSFVAGCGVVDHGRRSHEADEDGNRDRQEAAGTSMSRGEEEMAGQWSDEVLFEHDVYEVQELSDEQLQGIAGESSGPVSHRPDSDRLGKPDLLLYSEDDEDRSNRNGIIEYARDGFTVPLSEAAANSGPDTWWEEVNWRACWKGEEDVGSAARSKTGRRQRFWTLVEDEVRQLSLRVMALETDRHLLKQTVDSLRENAQIKLLREIAAQLRELRAMEWKGLQRQDSLL